MELNPHDDWIYSFRMRRLIEYAEFRNILMNSINVLRFSIDFIINETLGITRKRLLCLCLVSILSEFKGETASESISGASITSERIFLSIATTTTTTSAQIEFVATTNVHTYTFYLCNVQRVFYSHPHSQTGGDDLTHESTHGK